MDSISMENTSDLIRSIIQESTDYRALEPLLIKFFKVRYAVECRTDGKVWFINKEGNWGYYDERSDFTCTLFTDCVRWILEEYEHWPIKVGSE